MTGEEFAHRCRRYFGGYKPGEEYVLQVVSEFVANKSGEFLAELWALLAERREKYKGPPDLKQMMALKEEAAINMELHRPVALAVDAVKQLPGPVGERPPITQADIDSWPTREDDVGDRWLSHQESHEALGLVYAKLAAKDQPFADKAQKRWGRASPKINERGRE